MIYPSVLRSGTCPSWQGQLSMFYPPYKVAFLTEYCLNITVISHREQGGFFLVLSCASSPLMEKGTQAPPLLPPLPLPSPFTDACESYGVSSVPVGCKPRTCSLLFNSRRRDFLFLFSSRVTVSSLDYGFENASSPFVYIILVPWTCIAERYRAVFFSVLNLTT